MIEIEVREIVDPTPQVAFKACVDNLNFFNSYFIHYFGCAVPFKHEFEMNHITFESKITIVDSYKIQTLYAHGFNDDEIFVYFISSFSLIIRHKCIHEITKLFEHGANIVTHMISCKQKCLLKKKDLFYSPSSNIPQVAQ